MNTVVMVPIPMESTDTWNIFKPFVSRFCDTYRKFPAGVAHRVIAIINGADATEEVADLFRGINVDYIRYDGGGCDIGSFQYASTKIRPSFAVCCVSRVYFHRRGWLKQLVNARFHQGPGLYGTSVSNEGGRTHVCTRMYALESKVFGNYPTVINSRDQGTFFEVGRDNPLGTLADYHNRIGLRSWAVYWSGIYSPSNWFQPPNIFRTGDQSNMLAWDKHSDNYANANNAEKSRLQHECFGKVASPSQQPQ